LFFIIRQSYGSANIPALATVYYFGLNRNPLEIKAQIGYLCKIKALLK